MRRLIDLLEAQHTLPDQDLLSLITMDDAEADAYLAQRAAIVRQRHYGNDVFIRGLIEISNYCKNDCHYCGIRRGNRCCQRYRLTEEQILACCHQGYEAGFRTFVMQGGEDPYFSRERMAALIRSIKQSYPDCAVTLSLGELDRETYQEWFDAGADRYLLRHETANARLYRALHPEPLTLENRMRCLYDLKEIGYQTGCGFMVGSPGQTPEMILEDLRFIQEFRPHMVGIGPFIPHQETIFRDQPAGSAELTLRLLSIVRLMLPDVLLPATTALGTVLGDGRQQGMLHGCNVVMPNLSPPNVRGKYTLYDNKLITGAEAAESLRLLAESMAEIGYRVVTARGDWKGGST
ncbi:MAG: [FeFe] hydrogenase H-cluster radical SAM maturase HydE [Ruminococcaceae bacterium]|nr:[FeFe] hydrogenase H-cluster radical SAM maturase HydE [Oscillospiraceae bacterium]